MEASSSAPATPILNKKRSKSAISVVIPHEPFADNRDPLSAEDIRRVVEEKIYWTNEARAWKERAQELMAALREISEYVPTFFSFLFFFFAGSRAPKLRKLLPALDHRFPPLYPFVPGMFCYS